MQNTWLFILSFVISRPFPENGFTPYAGRSTCVSLSYSRTPKQKYARLPPPVPMGARIAGDGRFFSRFLAAAWVGRLHALHISRENLRLRTFP